MSVTGIFTTTCRSTKIVWENPWVFIFFFDCLKFAFTLHTNIVEIVCVQLCVCVTCESIIWKAVGMFNKAIALFTDTLQCEQYCQGILFVELYDNMWLFALYTSYNIIYIGYNCTNWALFIRCSEIFSLVSTA